MGHRKYTQNPCHRCDVLLLLLIGLFCAGCWAQPAKPATAQPEQPPDRIGRSTPRGTVFGFLNTARRGDYKAAAQYLNTRLRGDAAATLAQQLYVVLDRRLPPRLGHLSDKPEGSLENPGDPNQDLVGTIQTVDGPMDIALERVEQPKASPFWLFSTNTLGKIPDLYEEVESVAVESYIPRALFQPRIFGIGLIEWLAVLVGPPIVYFLIALIDLVLGRWIGRLRRRWLRNPDLLNPRLLANPVRLFIIAALIRWMLSKVSLPLLSRQLWSAAGFVIIVAGCVWLIIQLIAWGERRVVGRLSSRNLQVAIPLLRFARQAFNLFVLFAGVVVGLGYFGVNTTAALAGLGVGGIAIALAAQKTLENVIGGLSLILDRTVAVGDFLKVGGAEGTVTQIGLRSTRIRTPDRTIVSVPNGQIATASLENVSVRDKFWFNHTLGLRYETSASQMRAVLEKFDELLVQHPSIERNSIRVRFLRFGGSSLDVEIVAYLFARDWNHFLTIQEELLLRIMDIVRISGTEIALPSQYLYVAGHGHSTEVAVAK